MLQAGGSQLMLPLSQPQEGSWAQAERPGNSSGSGCGGGCLLAGLAAQQVLRAWSLAANTIHMLSMPCAECQGADGASSSRDKTLNPGCRGEVGEGFLEEGPLEWSSGR